MTKKLRVNIDLQPCCTEYSGVGYYTSHIAQELHDSENFVYQGNVQNFSRRDLSSLRSSLSFPMREIKYMPGRVYRLLERTVHYMYNFLFGTSDITHFFGYLVPEHIKGKVVNTVYDMVCFRFPETMDAANRDVLNQRLLKSIKRSDRIVTISEFSKREIVELTGYPEDRIDIVYPAASVIGTCEEIGGIRKKYGITGPYILFVGSIEPRKNLQKLIQAYNRLREQNVYSGQLVLCGGKGWSNEAIFDEAKASKWTKDIIFTGYVSDGEKNGLYKNADVFVYPSIYEGFGIPPLEAMYWKTPVVCSDAASIPEVGGDAVCYVDPGSEEAIAAGLEKVLTDRNYRKYLIRKGTEQYKKFSWEKSARKLEETYRLLQ